MFEAQTKAMKLDAFITYALLPENIGHNLELINGEIVKKRPVSNRNLDIITRLVTETRRHCDSTGIPCVISTCDGPYHIGQNIVGPDFAYKTTGLTNVYPDPPLWIAEVMTPEDRMIETSGKRRKYIQSGILYWEVYPAEYLVDVYVPGKPMKTYGINDVIAVNVIAGLKIPVAKLFR